MVQPSDKAVIGSPKSLDWSGMERGMRVMRQQLTETSRGDSQQSGTVTNGTAVRNPLHIW